jgi:hypothetical protein
MSRKHKPRLAALHRHFLSLLPRIELHGRIYFRGLKCRFRQEDLIAEMVALCWAWYLRLARRGKDVTEFFVTFCRLAGRAVRSGRRVAGQEWAKEVLSARARDGSVGGTERPSRGLAQRKTRPGMATPLSIYDGAKKRYI